MKPIKQLHWLLAAIPVTAIVAFYLRSNHEQSARPPAPNTVITPSVTTTTVTTKGHDIMPPQFAPDGSRIKEPSLAEIAARKRYQEAKQKVVESKERRVESFKKLAEKYTPEFMDRAADSIMKRRGEDYQKLFVAWNLDGQTIHEALGIMREREYRLLENRRNYFKDSSGVQSAKTAASDDQAEDASSRELLSLLLGESRATELVNTAKKLLKDELANAAVEISRRN